jgi:hypothetical protein
MVTKQSPSEADESPILICTADPIKIQKPGDRRRRRWRAPSKLPAAGEMTAAAPPRSRISMNRPDERCPFMGRRPDHHNRPPLLSTVTLSFVEAFADNGRIASILTGAGFADVTVTGSGNTRTAAGRWTGATMTRPIDPHLGNARDLSG